MTCFLFHLLYRRIEITILDMIKAMKHTAMRKAITKDFLIYSYKLKLKFQKPENTFHQNNK